MTQVASRRFDLVARSSGRARRGARGARGVRRAARQPQLLSAAPSELHQVQGVLRVLEIYGAALLAEEMEQVARYLQEAADRAQEPAREPRCADARDGAAAVLPRARARRRARPRAGAAAAAQRPARGARQPAAVGRHAAAAEPEVRPPAPSPAPPARRGEPKLTVAQWARRLRARSRSASSAGSAASASPATSRSSPRRASGSSRSRRPAGVPALVGDRRRHRGAARDGLEGSVSVKRLLGPRRPRDQAPLRAGRAALRQTPPVELLNNLLYYVARAPPATARASRGPRVVPARRAAAGRRERREERENLSAPSVKLMQTVAAAIREDLGKVKDVLDIFVRRGGAQAGRARAAGRAAAQDRRHARRARPRRAARAASRASSQRLEDIVAEREPPTEAAAGRHRGDADRVEDRLDDSCCG
jgi:chemosensory pili system protein ChpA (sensor histidine kinase/response regulator)